jgi:hypothetical protein
VQSTTFKKHYFWRGFCGIVSAAFTAHMHYFVMAASAQKVRKKIENAIA